MLEKFKALAWHMQLIVLVGIAALVYLSVWYFVTSGTRAEISALEDQIAQKTSQNEAARIATQRINEFRSLYASKSQEYDELKVLLPEQREITNVLQGLQDTAGESRLVVMRFTPREDSQQEYIMAKPVEIEVDSNFTSLRDFFEKMAKLQRIVSITDFKLMTLNNQSDARTLHAQFLLTAYYATPEDLVKPAVQPTKPGQKPAPNGQQPAPQQPAAK
ncbi:MAG TPA: type 4a pilus biogenesis protein PilO [Pyrinomonadaceae bacterium]|jgi:type IV pilus assembly protein PilO|nr:type 4a pilus biogenesis protein PilO [Pyrinomonadaceae bacterium]